MFFALLPSAFLAIASAQDLRLTEIATGIPQPTDIQNAADGSGRIFVLEQRGRIRIVQNGQLLERPFLDITANTQANGECGLLGLAFPPDFKSKQYFYVDYTDRACRNTVVARYRVSSTDANLADATSETVILTQPQPFPNHNGGQLAFGPDGYLYISFGDGGSANDPQGNAQNRMSRLGKILRVDVESDPARYRIPPTNPFASDSSALPEIWAYGLRNPWRFSFDRETGDLWIADVGQDRAEEIDFQSAASRGGENYGWNPMEGMRCRVSNCDPSRYVLPVLEYASRAQGDISVTGGYVYRGSRWPALRGLYIYADYGSGRIWGIRHEGNRFDNQLLLESRLGVTTFGQDESGELYLANQRAGNIFRLDSTEAAPQLTLSSVGNVASGEPGITPGSLAVAITQGVRPGPDPIAAASIPLPTSLAGVRVTVNGREVPIVSISAAFGPERITFQTPWDLTGQTAEVIVWRETFRTAPAQIPIVPLQPAVYMNGARPLIVRVNTASISETLPRSEPLYFYASGLGPVDNAPSTGAASPTGPLATLRQSLTVLLDNQPVDVQFAGLAPGSVGLYQVNITVPDSVPPGNHRLILEVAGIRGSAIPVAVE